MGDIKKLGFIGLGVMGEPMCRNLAVKQAIPVLAFDTQQAPLERLGKTIHAAKSVGEVMRGSDLVFLSLPSGEVVSQICEQADGLLENCRAGQIVVDLSTSPVELTRELYAKFKTKGVLLMDAPVARTRAAAESGTLSIMVGGLEPAFAQIEPYLSTFATEITLCGPVGSGQVVKILNNMVLFETIAALSEARAIAQKAGVDPKKLFETLALGSADSFALRNHGLKAIIPEDFPERAFSVEYAAKDLRYALDLAEQTQVDAAGARNVRRLFELAVQRGDGALYHPVISRVLETKL
jgi:3-hydroxyisobutyrate dehydrogenase-like beta-hydroxyacid dehydrogenase